MLIGPFITNTETRLAYLDMWPQNVLLVYDGMLAQGNIYAKIELVESAVSKEKKLEAQNGAPKARASRGV